MNLCYRPSEPHPDSDAAHLGPSLHSCVRIMRRRVPHEHIAECPAVAHGDANADSIAIRGDHRCQMAGGVLPVCHSLFGNSFGVRDREHRQVGPEAVGIPSRCHRLTFHSVIMMGVQVGGTFLSRIHERLIDCQFWNAVLLPYLVDASDQFLLNLHICRLGTDFLYRGKSGIRRIRVDLYTVL